MTTFATNVMGTVNVLEAVRTSDTVKACVVVTSDKCYENREWQQGYVETDAMGGHDMNRNYEGLDFRAGYGSTSDGQGDNESLRSRTARSSASSGTSSARSRSANRSDRVRPARARRLVPALRHRREPGRGRLGNTSVPQRLVLPNVYSRQHTPAGKIGRRATRPGGLVNTFT